MTKADNIRKALTAVSPGGLTYAQLADKTGIPVKKLGPNLAAFTQRGEITTKADGEGVTRYHINLDYNKSAGGGERVSRKGKKPAAGKKAKRAKSPRKAKRPYKRLVDKHAKPNGAGLRDLTLANLLAAGALLRQAIEDGIEDLEGNHALRNAIANQQRAEELHAAAKP